MKNTIKYIANGVASALSRTANKIKGKASKINKDNSEWQTRYASLARGVGTNNMNLNKAEYTATFAKTLRPRNY